VLHTYKSAAHYGAAGIQHIRISKYRFDLIRYLLWRKKMRELLTEIEINVSMAKVWEVLTNLRRFAEWNPFIREAKGKVKEGSRLRLRIEPPGGKGMTFNPTVTRVVPESEFRWLGHLLIPGLFDGEHIFEIKSLKENSVNFTQREQFRGLLVPLLWNNLEAGTRQGFNEMNVALKKEAENERVRPENST
jgi:hypothetical protein